MASLSHSLSWPLAVLVLLLSCVASRASDPDPVQDFCVALLQNQQPIALNGLVCKDPNQVVSADFMSPVLRNPGNTNNALGSAVQLGTALTFPALNTQGLSVNRIDFAPKGGLNPPHVHPRSSEVLILLQGTLLVGFVSTNNTSFQQTLYPGELFLVPRGLVHFQLNVGDVPAVAIAAFNSQNPGASVVANALFAAEPPLPEQVLEKGFGIEQRELNLVISGVRSTRY